MKNGLVSTVPFLHGGHAEKLHLILGLLKLFVGLADLELMDFLAIVTDVAVGLNVQDYHHASGLL